jgi:hypothetical protein
VLAAGVGGFAQDLEVEVDIVAFSSELLVEGLEMKD